MANKEHLRKLREDIQAWNAWRDNNPGTRPDLIDANLSEADLRVANLRVANLSGASVNIANLTRANLFKADLRDTNLSGADLSDADLSDANLYGAILGAADLSEANCARTTFACLDLSALKGLETIVHGGPSTVGVDTIYLSNWNEETMPRDFLKGCGLTDRYIDYIPSLLAAEKPIQFYSCFISYSHKNEEFTKQLHGKLQQRGLRVWYAPEDLKAGRKIHREIDSAIRFHDKLLIVLSEESIRSNWVELELRRARKRERKEGRQILFPIRLMSFEKLKEWECIDADEGRDLAAEIREYYIPDFSDAGKFDVEFEKLMDALQKEDGEKKPAVDSGEPVSQHD